MGLLMVFWFFVIKKKPKNDLKALIPQNFGALVLHRVEGL